jgi:serine/threonine-protein kinase
MTKQGESISHYRVLEKLGEGGMGVVYKAEDQRLHRFVALKFLPDKLLDDDTARRRFDAEARAASALDHPNICSIYDVGQTDDGHHYLALAYCEGETLRSRMARGPMNTNEAVDVGRQLADGLAAAHAKGIVHRDVKPANIMVRPDGLVKILDFGVAKLQDDVADITRTSTTVGSPSYMSPEQVQGRDITPRADVWSLGVVLYELLSGRRAFAGRGVSAVMYSILNEEPAPLRGLRPELAPQLCAIVEKALEKRPGRRFATAREMAIELHALAEGGTTATPSVPFDGGQPTLTAIASATTVDPSIAVLPFSDLSPQKDQDWFCEGIAEELINALTQVPQLRTASRASTAQFRDHLDEPHTMGDKLRVSNLLQGSVRKAGEQLRITTQLVRASDGTVLASEKFDRDMSDIFALQEEIALSVVETLKVHLGRSMEAPVVRPPTESITAYNLYLEGRHRWNRRSATGFDAGERLFLEALERDPRYSRAHAGLADLNITRAIYGLAPAREAMERAREHCLEALEIDPRLADARVSLGQIRAYFDWDWEGAEAEYSQAVALDPRYAFAWAAWAGTVLTPLGRFDEALAHYDTALQIDPVSLPVNASRGVCLFLARRFEDAEAQLRSTLEIDPDFMVARLLLMELLAVVGRGEQALEIESNDSFEAHSFRGFALALAGRREEARRVLAVFDEADDETWVNPSYRARVHLALGELETALDCLDSAAEARSSLLIWAGHRPEFDPLRSDPRFEMLLASMGLANTAYRGTPQLQTGG